MAKVVILGGGFGGLIAAERLSASIDPSHQITLVSPNPEFTFYPSLVRLAFGECEREDITFDLRRKLNDANVNFVQGEMLGIDPNARTVTVTGDDFNGDISYDFLIIATGRRLATEKVGGFFEYAHHLLGVKAALKFGDAVNKFREGNIIIGMCPDARLPVPVCEAAFAIARKFENEIRGGEMMLKVLFPDSLETVFGGATLHRELEASFRHHGINVLYDVPITDISENEVTSSIGHLIHHDLLMLVPPFRGNASLKPLGITDEFDFVKVDRFLRVPNLDHVYAIGDITDFPGPKLAHMAVRQADVAAANIRTELEGGKPIEDYYHEIAMVIDAGGADSIYVRYGITDEKLYGVRKGRLWGLAKSTHDRLWQARHG
jgi:sulfide:quinone oxidoreductase